jgi:hypothetical protein
LFSSLKEDNVIETVQKITETETVINESLSLIAPFPHPLTNRSLNSKNMKHLINYINKSKNSGIFSIDKLILMRYLNSWLASSANNNESHNYQQSITHTFTKWHFSQPVFPNNISIKKENCKDNIKLYVHKTENYSIVIMYRDTDDSDISEYDIIQPGIFNSWIDNIMMNNDNISSETSKEGVELEGFEFFPILHAQAQPQANAQANAPGGGAKSAYKRTKNYKQYKLKKYVIYEGKRGGKYIHLNNKYVSLNKIV